MEHWITSGVWFIAELAITLAAIDIVSGLVHWAEDTFGTESSPVFGKWIIAPNVIHHEHPAAFIRKTWLQSSWDLALASSLIVLSPGGWIA